MASARFPTLGLHSSESPRTVPVPQLAPFSSSGGLPDFADPAEVRRASRAIIININIIIKCYLCRPQSLARGRAAGCLAPSTCPSPPEVRSRRERHLRHLHVRKVGRDHWQAHLGGSYRREAVLRSISVLARLLHSVRLDPLGFGRNSRRTLRPAQSSHEAKHQSRSQVPETGCAPGVSSALRRQPRPARR